MKASNPSRRTADQLTHRTAVFPLLKQRRQHQSNIWFFESPKNCERIAIHSDLAFMHLVLLEGDPAVVRYQVEQLNSHAAQETPNGDERAAATVYMRDGAVQWWDFQREQQSVRRRGAFTQDCSSGATKAAAAIAAGAAYHVKTDQDLMGKEILFDNWLTLCALMSRCRNQFLGRETGVMLNALATGQSLRLGYLADLPGIDPALMHGAVAHAMQSGVIFSNLATQMLGRSSFLSLVPQ